MSDQQIEAMIQEKGLTAPRIHPNQIAALMDHVCHTFVVLGTSTFCHGFLDGKFLLATGHSACVSPENFNAEIGERISYKDMEGAAVKKLWELEGYRLYRGDN